MRGDFEYFRDTRGIIILLKRARAERNMTI